MEDAKYEVKQEEDHEDQINIMIGPGKSGREFFPSKVKKPKAAALSQDQKQGDNLQKAIGNKPPIQPLFSKKPPTQFGRGFNQFSMRPTSVQNRNRLNQGGVMQRNTSQLIPKTAISTKSKAAQQMSRPQSQGKIVPVTSLPQRPLTAKPQKSSSRQQQESKQPPRPPNIQEIAHVMLQNMQG